MSCEKSTAMLPKPGPDLFEVGLWELEAREPFATKECEGAFPMCRRKGIDAACDFEQKHEPMRLPLISVLANQAGKMQIAGGKLNPQFFLSFAASARIGRFAVVCVKFPSAGTPETSIGLLRALEQEHFVPVVETIQQRGDFVRQRHA
jgi:hypothetical protein